MMKNLQTKQVLAYRGCPTLHQMDPITLSTKYVIPISKIYGFPNFQSFPAPSSVSTAYSKNTKEFQRKNLSDVLFYYFILKHFCIPSWINRFNCWGPNALKSNDILCQMTHMTSQIWYKSIWQILVSKEALGPFLFLAHAAETADGAGKF